MYFLVLLEMPTPSTNRYLFPNKANEYSNALAPSPKKVLEIVLESSNDFVVKAFCTIDSQSSDTIFQYFCYKIGLKPPDQSYQ